MAHARSHYKRQRGGWAGRSRPTGVELGSVRIERLDDTTAVLNFFGATGLLAVPVKLERFTVE
jgi:hypothetical protein